MNWDWDCDLWFLCSEKYFLVCLHYLMKAYNNELIFQIIRA
jgi:hypothetical protein